MNLDPGAITLIQTTFLEHLSGAFTHVAHYALNLLYLFAVLELVIFGFIWALQREVGWDRLFFKVIKIGLIFFIIQNYPWLLDTIMKSFAQLAGVTIRDAKVAQYLFNPATIWQYGYNAGLNLLQIATASNSFGMVIILVGLGLGILLTFGLLGIQVVLQVVGFYVVALGALIFLPFGAFAQSRNMFDRGVQSVLKAGVSLMVLIMVVGVAVTVWDGFQLTELATAKTININQPLGLFFTSLLFLCLAFYLPRVSTSVVGNIGSMFVESGGATHVTMPAMISGTMPTGAGLSDMQAATTIETTAPAAGGSATGGQTAAAAAISASPVVVTQGAAGQAITSGLTKGAITQASEISRSISEHTIKAVKETIHKAMQEKS